MSQLREKPLPTGLSLSGPPLRRKPIGGSKRSQTSLPSSTKTPLQQDPIHEDSPMSVTREAMTQSPTPIQSAEFSNQVLTRQSHLAHGHSSHPQFNRKPATSVSLPAVPTIQSLDSDINRPDQDGDPLLVTAAGDGLGEMIEKLLTNGPNIEAVNATTKRNALIEASMQGHARIVEFLLDYRCSTQHLNSDHMSALHHSAQKGYLLVAKALLDRGAAVDIQGLNGLTPLYLASWAPHASMVMRLSQRHANVNGRDAY